MYALLNLVALQSFKCPWKWVEGSVCVCVCMFGAGGRGHRLAVLRECVFKGRGGWGGRNLRPLWSSGDKGDPRETQAHAGLAYLLTCSTSSMNFWPGEHNLQPLATASHTLSPSFPLAPSISPLPSLFWPLYSPAPFTPSFPSHFSFPWLLAHCPLCCVFLCWAIPLSTSPSILPPQSQWTSHSLSLS